MSRDPARQCGDPLSRDPLGWSRGPQAEVGDPHPWVMQAVFTLPRTGSEDQQHPRDPFFRGGMFGG